MKYAIITHADSKGTETNQMFWLLDSREGGILHTAPVEYCERNKSQTNYDMMTCTKRGRG